MNETDPDLERMSFTLTILEPSPRTVADSYDNALVETVNGLFKTELIRRQAPWRTVEDVE